MKLDNCELNGLRSLLNLRCEVTDSRHYLTSNVIARHDDILSRWNVLREASDRFQGRLMEVLSKHKNDKKLAKFSKRANAIYTWIELARKELYKPIQMDSREALKQVRETLMKLKASKCKVLLSFEKLHKLYGEIQSLGIARNPYSRLDMKTLTSMYTDLEKTLAKRITAVDMMLQL